MRATSGDMFGIFKVFNVAKLKFCARIGKDNRIEQFSAFGRGCATVGIEPGTIPKGVVVGFFDSRWRGAYESDENKTDKHSSYRNGAPGNARTGQAAKPDPVSICAFAGAGEFQF